jgi:hypothetical protein
MNDSMLHYHYSHLMNIKSVFLKHSRLTNKIAHPFHILRLLRPVEPVEKLIFCRLVKNARMQGARRMMAIPRSAGRMGVFQQPV